MSERKGLKLIVKQSRSVQLCVCVCCVREEPYNLKGFPLRPFVGDFTSAADDDDDGLCELFFFMATWGWGSCG